MKLFDICHIIFKYVGAEWIGDMGINMYFRILVQNIHCNLWLTVPVKSCTGTKTNQ